MFTIRQLRIIKAVFNIQGIHGKELADLIGVTPRTVRNEICSINDECKDILISSNHQKGYYVNADVYDRLNLPNIENIVDNNENRLYRILGKILYEEYYSVYDLEEYLCISESVVRSELINLNRIMNYKYCNQLLKIKKDIIYVKYNEQEIRKLLFDIIKDELISSKNGYINILSIISNDQKIVKEFEDIRNIVNNILNIEGIELNEIDLNLLISYIQICRVRNIFGYKVYYNDDVKLSKIFTTIIKTINYLTIDDIKILQLFFNTLKIRHIETNIDEFTKVLFNEFCDTVFEKYSLELRDSKNISDEIMIHLEYLLRRISYNYELKNPIIEDIKAEFSFAFEVSMLLVQIIYKYKKIYISEDEVAYIAIYIQQYIENTNYKLKVCVISRQRDSVNNIAIKWLNDNFSNLIEIVDIINKADLVKDVDLIITLNEPDVNQSDTYMIRSIPDSKDKDRIFKLINHIKFVKKINEVLKCYITSDNINIYEDDVKDISRIFRQLVNNLYLKGIIDDEEAFYNDLINREKNYPTYLGNRMMLPHTLFNFSNKLHIEVAILKKPLKYNGKNIQIIFLIATEKSNNYNMDILFYFFNQISKSDKYIDNLIYSKDIDEFIKQLNEFKFLI